MRRCKEEMIACDRHTICGRLAHYRLTKLHGKGIYLIAVCFGKDRAVQRICGKIDDVLRIYRSVEKNSVTPCTLSDVIKDITFPCE